MRVIKYDWPRRVSAKKPAVIYVFADTHIPFDDREKLTEHVVQCKKEKAGWFHLGDWCDFITPKDRRFSIQNPPPAITEQIDEAVAVFEPIKKQGIAVLSGNHEESIERNYGSIMAGRGGIATLLGVPYLGDMGFVHMVFKETKTRWFAHTFFLWHGHGAGYLLGAKSIKLQRLSGKFNADIYLIGHVHTYLDHIDKIIGAYTSGVNLPFLNEKMRYYASAPGYLVPYKESEIPNYVTARALYPQPSGCLRIEIGKGIKIEAVLE